MLDAAKEGEASRGGGNVRSPDAGPRGNGTLPGEMIARNEYEVVTADQNQSQNHSGSASAPPRANSDGNSEKREDQACGRKGEASLNFEMSIAPGGASSGKQRWEKFLGVAHRDRGRAISRSGDVDGEVGLPERGYVVAIRLLRIVFMGASRPQLNFDLVFGRAGRNLGVLRGSNARRSGAPRRCQENVAPVGRRGGHILHV